MVVDFSRGSIKMALAESACEAVRFRGITRFDEGPGEPDGPGEVTALDTQRIVDLIRPEVQRRGWRGLPAACLLSGAATSTQSFQFPPMPAPDLRRAIGLKMSETLHFDLEQACFDHRRLSEQKPDAPTLTLVAAARIDAIRQGVSALRQAGLRPVAIGAAAESLANLSQCTSLWNSQEASIHVDLGTDSAILNLFEGNQLRFSREIETGSSAFVRALMRPILTPQGPVQLTLEEAQQVHAAAGFPMEEASLPHGVRASDILPLVEPVAQRIAAEIGRSIDYLCALLDRPGIDKVVLSGSAGTMRNLDRFLQDSLGTLVVCSDPVARAMSHWRLAVCDDHPPDLADFSAILGYSLGNRQPINLLPREEQLVQLVERVSSVRKTAVPTIAALGFCIAFAGIPIESTYQSAGENLERTLEQVDARMRRKAADGVEQLRTDEALGRVRSARGVIPDWTGILKELAAILPQAVQIISLEAQSSRGSAELTLEARIHPERSPFYAVTSRLTVALAESPFFEDVHVIGASMASGESRGRYEATFRVVAGGADPP